MYFSCQGYLLCLLFEAGWWLRLVLTLTLKSLFTKAPRTKRGLQDNTEEGSLPDKISAMGAEGGCFEKSWDKFMASSGEDILLSQCSASFNGLFLLDEFGGLGSWFRAGSFRCCHNLSGERQRGYIAFVVPVSRKRPIAWTEAAHVGAGTHKWRKEKKIADCKDRLVFRNCDAKKTEAIAIITTNPVYVSYPSFSFCSLSTSLSLAPDCRHSAANFDMTSSKIWQ